MSLTPAQKMYQRQRRQITKNAATRKYEKTKNGFLMRLYRNMQSRVNGVQRAKRHLYEGLPILSRYEFYDWAHRNNTFHHLFGQWENSGYDRRITPTVNRIDATRGYELPNIEWLTHSENSRMTRRWHS